MTVGAAQLTRDVLESLDRATPRAALLLSAAPLIIGSDRSCGLVLSGDPAVAPLHCRIVREGTTCILQDLGSAAGTSINGQRVGSRFLRSGDVIQVGSRSFRFVRHLPITKPARSTPVGAAIVLASVAALVGILAVARTPKIPKRLDVGTTAVLAPAPSFPQASFSPNPLPPQGPLSSGQSLPDPPAPPSGLFTERPGIQEWPVVHVTHDSGSSTLTLTSTDGKIFTVTFSVESPGEISVPPGEYRVDIRSLDANVDPNSGTAVFRRYKRYEAAFTHSPAWLAEPFRLGDQ